MAGVECSLYAYPIAMCLLMVRKRVSLASMLVLTSRGGLGLWVRDVSSASFWLLALHLVSPDFKNSGTPLVSPP